MSGTFESAQGVLEKYEKNQYVAGQVRISQGAFIFCTGGGYFERRVAFQKGGEGGADILMWAVMFFLTFSDMSPPAIYILLFEILTHHRTPQQTLESFHKPFTQRPPPRKWRPQI